MERMGICMMVRSLCCYASHRASTLSLPTTIYKSKRESDEKCKKSALKSRILLFSITKAPGQWQRKSRNIHVACSVTSRRRKRSLSLSSTGMQKTTEVGSNSPASPSPSKTCLGEAVVCEFLPLAGWVARWWCVCDDRLFFPLTYPVQ